MLLQYICGSDFHGVLRLCSKNKWSKKWEEMLKETLPLLNMKKEGTFKKRPFILTPARTIYDLAKAQNIKHLFKIQQPMALIDDDPIRTVNYHLFSLLLSRTPAKGLIAKYRLFDRMWDYDLLKHLGDQAKFLGPQFDKHWHFLVNIETLFGWRPIPNGPKIWEQVLQWTNKVFHPNIFGSEELFNAKFRLKIREILNWKTPTKDGSLTIQEFVQQVPVMGTSGSAYDPKLSFARTKFKVGDVEIVPRQNKFSKTLALSEIERDKILRTNIEHLCNVSIKMEFFPKVRTIISMNYSAAEQMRYIDMWLKKHFKGNKVSTLWSTSTQKWIMWNEFAKMNGANVPVDQSKFDWHVSKTMVRIMNEELLSLIEQTFGSESDMYLVMDNIKKALSGGKIVYNFENQKYTTEYENGVLSGWGFTAWYDTMANLAEMRISEEICDSYGVHISTVLENVQGDDQLKTTSTFNQALAYWAGMASTGVEVNASKNFFSHQHNEYLRKGSQLGMVIGYPARMINAMCWVYPGTSEHLEPIERLNAMTSNWEKLSNRFLMTLKQNMDLLRSDVKGAKLQQTLFEQWFAARKTAGGYQGDTKINDLRVEIFGGSWRGGLIIGKGYEDFRLRYGENQARELDS